MQQDHWMQVATTSSQVEAEMLRDLLGSEGIASLVQTSDAVAYLGVISPCRILVRQFDADRASAFLHAWEVGTSESFESGDHDSDSSAK